uniref:C2H2-type domain-containing protein n=1 Tax=Steinernema glaseri TaxID=37863 RepID=A0A1I8AHG5_9BILA
MHRSSGAMASNDKKEFLNKCRDIKNTLVGLLDDQKEFRREMMDYNSRIAHGRSTIAMNNRENSPQLASADEEEEGSSDEDGRHNTSSEEESEESDEMTGEGATPSKQEEIRKPITVRDYPISETFSIWKCAVCKKEIKGRWQNRQSHIKVHEYLNVSCPVGRCSMTLAHTSLRNHLKMKHNMTCNVLPSREKALLQKELDRNNEIVMNCELKYFPPTSFISFSETALKEAVKPFCKKCGKRCIELQSRRDHVALKLKVTMDCPVRGCPYGGCYGAMWTHLKQKHQKKLSDLNRAERERFDNAKDKFYKKVDIAMPKFFS